MHGVSAEERCENAEDIYDDLEATRVVEVLSTLREVAVQLWWSDKSGFTLFLRQFVSPANLSTKPEVATVVTSLLCLCSRAWRRAPISPGRSDVVLVSARSCFPCVGTAPCKEDAASPDQPFEVSEIAKSVCRDCRVSPFEHRHAGCWRTHASITRRAGVDALCRAWKLEPPWGD